MNFNFPNHCCCCMGPAESTVEMSKVKSHIGQLKTYTVHVPICKQCKKEKFEDAEASEFKMKAYMSIGGFIVGALIVSILKTEILSENIFWEAVSFGTIFGFVGYLIGYLVTQKSEDDLPVKIEVDEVREIVRLRFKNQEFNQLFYSMN